MVVKTKAASIAKSNLDETRALIGESYRTAMTMFGDMLARDRERFGFTVSQAAWRFGMRPSQYRELQAGKRSPSFDTYDRICKLFGWPQAYIGPQGAVAYR